MMITRTKLFLIGLFLAAVLGPSTAQASVMVGLILNPSSTAGGGSTSTRSGNGSWQMYAIESADSTSFGISSYSITMSGTTAINHRAPVTTINDSNGDPQTAGFNLLRTGTNVNPIQASQGLPGSTPFLITGFGQTASDFTTAATAIDAGATVVGPTTSGVWGNYSRPELGAGSLSLSAPEAAAAVNAGRKWLFLAEGTGPAGVTQITSAVITVFTNASGASANTQTQILGLSCLGCTLPPTVSSTTINVPSADVPGSVAYTFTSLQSASWGNFSFVSGPSPAVAPAFNASTQAFNWNTVGSPIGSYKWSVQASNSNGTGTGFVTVNVTVPEPAVGSIVGIGLIVCVFIRRRTLC